MARPSHAGRHTSVVCGCTRAVRRDQCARPRRMPARDPETPDVPRGVTCALCRLMCPRHRHRICSRWTMPHGIPAPSVAHGNGSKESHTPSARPAGIGMARPHRRCWSSRRTQDDQRPTPTSGAAVVAQHGVLLPMPTFLTACTWGSGHVTCRPRWEATRAEKQGNRCLGRLPLPLPDAQTRGTVSPCPKHQ